MEVQRLEGFAVRSLELDLAAADPHDPNPLHAIGTIGSNLETRAEIHRPRK
jgi:hypothetical protein